MRTLRKSLRWVSKYLALAVLIGVPAIALWGALQPWSPAERTFATVTDKTPLLVGMHYRYQHAPNRTARTESRSYLLVPSTLSWPTLVTISQTGDDPPKSSEPSVTGFLGLLGTLAVAAFLVWRNWFRAGHARAA